MKKYLLLFVLTALTSCSNNDNNSNQNSLEGKWSWIKTTGGFGGPSTSETSNQKIEIEFSGSTLKTYTNGNLTQQKFFLITKKSIFGGDKEMIVIDKGLSITQEVYIDRSFEIKGNKLFLIEECADCGTSEYVSIK